MKETYSRAHVNISGRVQGVFFRAETKIVAEELGISGWVRNCSNGDVEAIFEGLRKSVESMIEWCHKGSPKSKVENVKVEWEEYLGEYKVFGIRR